VFRTIHDEVCKGNLEKVKSILDQKIDINEKDSFGSSPLHYAARNSHTDIIKILLEGKADVNIKDKHGFTPLHEAVNSAMAKTIPILLDYKADLNIKDHYQNTPIDILEGRLEKPEILSIIQKEVEYKKEKELFHKQKQTLIFGLNNKSTSTPSKKYLCIQCGSL